MKLQINKTNKESKITFYNMQFQNIKEWNVEETTIDLTLEEELQD